MATNKKVKYSKIKKDCPHILKMFGKEKRQQIDTPTGGTCERCYEPSKYPPNHKSDVELEQEADEATYSPSQSGFSQSEVITPGESNEEETDTNFNFGDSIYIPEEKVKQQEIKGSSKQVNPEEFFKGKTHNVKLRIPDAPPPFRPDFFRQTFNKWMILLTHPYLAKYIITDRGSGKSKNASLYLLYRIYTERDKQRPEYPFYASFLMRNWDENTRMTKPQYERYIDDFAEFFFEDRYGKERKKFSLCWDILYRGIQFNKREVMPFINLYNPSESKKIDTPHQEVFFEESIPTKEQMLKDGGWISHGGRFIEDTNYEIVRKSASRGITNPRLTFLGNPNIPWIDIWFLTTHWEKELEEINKWYWSTTPKGRDMSALKKWRKWTWTKIYQKEVEGLGTIFLYLEKMEHEPKLLPSEEDWCWHNFFTPAEKLNILPFVNGSEPLYVFNGCICFWREQTKEDPLTTGYWSWIEIENSRYPNRDTLFSNIYEIVINEKQEAQTVSSGLCGVVRRREKKEFQRELLRKYMGGLLKFNSSKARRKMLTFIEDGKIVI